MLLRCESARRPRSLPLPSGGNILILDVNDATTQTQIVSRVITRQQFAAANTFQIFAVPFAVDASWAGHAISIIYAA